MERVLWPMEPVEPRMASFFTLLFSQIGGIGLVGSGGEDPVVHGCCLLRDGEPGLIAEAHGVNLVGEAVSQGWVLQEGGERGG